MVEVTEEDLVALLQDAIDQYVAEYEAQSGAEALSRLFGLSRAEFIVLPRSILQAMPEEWQKKFANLIDEYEDAYPYQPASYQVTIIGENGKYQKLPDWVNYRKCTVDDLHHMTWEGRKNY